MQSIYEWQRRHRSLGDQRVDADRLIATCYRTSLIIFAFVHAVNTNRASRWSAYRMHYAHQLDLINNYAFETLLLMVSIAASMAYSSFLTRPLTLLFLLLSTIFNGFLCVYLKLAFYFSCFTQYFSN